MIDLKQLPIAQLKPAPYNPRVALKPGMPGYDRLERSLKEFDLVEPIVWNDQTGHVVGGHQRLEILKQQGVENVDVSVVSLSLEREQALNIALNNKQVGSDWDPDKLLDVLTQLNDVPDFDATLCGFNAEELNDLLLVPDPDFFSDDESSQQNEEDDVVRVTLEIPYEQWDEIRPEIDGVLAERGVKVHVKLPN